jgi:hypothetical protein
MYNIVKMVQKQFVCTTRRVCRYNTYLVKGNIWYRQKKHVTRGRAIAQKVSLRPNNSYCIKLENLFLDIFYQWYYIFGESAIVILKKRSAMFIIPPWL